MARFGRSFPIRPIVVRAPLGSSVSLSRAVADQALASDTVTRTVTLPRGVSDNALASDVALHIQPRSVTDQALASDTVSRLAAYPRAVADNALAADVVSRLAALPRTVSDNALASDVVGRIPGRAAFDQALASDVVSRLVAAPRAVTDQGLASDTLVRAGAYLRSIVDSALLSDTVGSTLTHVVAPSPNWPLLGIDVDFQTGPPNTPTPSRSSINAAYRRLAVRKISTRRGRQYELDQVQTGEATLEIPDPNEVLNPDNAGSPFNQGGNVVTPYRSMWIWGMWPNQPGSGNIFAATVLQKAGLTSNYDPSFEAGTSLIDGRWDGTATIASSTAQAFQGTHSALITQAAAGFTKGVYVHSGLVTTPRVTYTFSAYVYCTGGCSVQVSAYDANGHITAGTTAIAQNVWTRVQVTWTTIDTLEYINISGTGSVTPTFYVDAAQLEFGASVAPFTTSGPTFYPIYTGYVERYPTKYDMSGIRAQRPLVAVDALAILSRTAINVSYTQVINQDSPNVVIGYHDQYGPNMINNNTGAVIGLGATSIAPGGAINYAGDSFLDGTAAATISQQTQDSTKTPYASQFTFLDIPRTNSFPLNTAGATIEFWMRWAVGSPTFMIGSNTSGNVVDYNSSVDHTQDSTFGVVVGANGLAIGTADQQPPSPGYVSLTGYPATTSGQFVFDGTNFPDGLWHYYSIALIAGTGANAGKYLFRVTVDSASVTTSGPVSSGNVNARFIGGDAITAAAVAVHQETLSTISVANLAIYPADIGNVRQQAHYLRGTGYAGETAGARVRRLLTQYWGGNVVISNGFMGLSADFDYDTRVMLDVLQEIQESERGLIFAGLDGRLRFEDRLTRYVANNDQALWVFGENPAGASPVEYPYEDYGSDHDPTFTFSQANLTRPDNSNFLPMVNSTAQGLYGQRILTQQVKCLTDFDLTQAGIFYLNRYGTPKTRLTTLRLQPSANPALFPVVMSLEIGQRVTVTRRSGGFTLTRDYYVEQVSHQVDAEQSKWVTELQLSPVFVPTSWLCGDTSRSVLGTSTVPVY